MADKIPFLSFHDGNKVPVLAIGTGSRSDPALITQAVEDAIDVGYMHIDCALIYKTEEGVGEAIRNKIFQGVVKREDLFITSKLWNTFHREDLVKIGLQKSLTNLGLTYLDLFLIHWPMAYKEGEDLSPKDDENQIIPSEVSYVETWKAMEKLVDQGLTKSIGVSNFNSQQILDILSIARIKPVANQVECHPYMNQKKLKEFCEGHNILIMGYSPLGSPHRLKDGQKGLLENSTLLTIAEKYKKTVPQILIKYQVQRGLIVVPKSTNKSRLASNADIFDFNLRDEDVRVIDSLDRGGRLCTGEEAKEHKYYPFNIEF